MEVSHELWALVETAWLHQARPTPSAKNYVLQQHAFSVEEQETITYLLNTSHTISEAVAKAIARASAHVHVVVVALDAATPSSTTHLQNNLLLSEAELLSVSTSLKAFTETLTKVDAVAAVKHKGKKTTTKHPDINTLFGRSANSEMSIVGAGTGLVSHLQQVVSIEEQRVAAKRLQVALAKEELALYKSELFLYGHCGVLSCSDAVAAQLAQRRPPPTPSLASPFHQQKTHSLIKNEEERGGCVHTSLPFTAAPLKPSRSGFGTTFRVVDGMMQRAAQTMRAAGNHADSALHVALTGSQAAARQLLNVGTFSVNDVVLMGVGGDRGCSSTASNRASNTAATTKVGVAAIPLPTVTRDELTKEEEARLQKQSQALLQLQREATAHDAKAVEASIRELSQLTSLMNEQVVQQKEQFSVLVRNTEVAHKNVQKAVDEVGKPLQVFWNPTRQLIALLWACMALVLAVNWVSR